MDYTRADLLPLVGKRVKAFHPRTLGAVYTPVVVAVGTKWVTVDFGDINGGRCKVSYADIVRLSEEW